MKALFASLIVFAVLSAVLLPLDVKFQRQLASEAAKAEAENAEWQGKIARGEIPAPSAPKYPTDAEVEAYWAARGGYKP